MSARRLAFVLVMLALASGLPSAAAGPVRVGLLPVQVHSNDPDSDYLSQGLASMLSSRLEQNPGVMVVAMEGQPTIEPAAAIEAGKGADVDYVVFGSFTQFGDGASLDISCAPVVAVVGEDENAEIGRRIFVSSGTLAEIIPKLDELSEKISRYLVGPPGVPVAAGAKPAAGAVDDLQRRVEALERAVFYGETGAEGKAEVSAPAEGEGAEASP